MVGFSDLSVELVTIIWDYVRDRRTVENFALTSKGIYALAGPALKEYRHCRARFSKYENFISRGEGEISPYSNGDTNHIASYLKFFLQNPHLASYVTECNLRQLKGSRRSHGLNAGLPVGELNIDDPPGATSILSDDDLKLFAKAFKDSEWIHRNEVKDWDRAMRDGEEDPLVALLMTLLPNLEQISMRLRPNTSRRFCQTVDRITNTQSTICLGRLRMVTIRGDTRYRRDEPRQALEPFNVFGALTSVRYMKLEDAIIEMEPKGMSGICRMPLNPNLTHLSIMNSMVCDKVLWESLAGPQRLRVFQYSDKAKIRHSPSIADWSVVSVDRNGWYGDVLFNHYFVRANLLTHAIESLEELDMFCYRGRTGGGCGASFMGDINSFKALKRLSTDCKSLSGGHDEINCAQLIEALPASIEEVNLKHIDPDVAIDPKAIIEGLLKVKQTSFPNLCRVDLRLKRETLQHPSPKKRAEIKSCKESCKKPRRGLHAIQTLEKLQALGRTRAIDTFKGLEKKALAKGIMLRLHCIS